MTSLSRTILIFAILFVILLITPAFLSQQFGPYPLMKTGDVTDMLTPLILLPLYWLVFRLNSTPTTGETVLFMVFASFWASGQGLHLGANSIGHLLEPGTDVYELTHTYDEVIGHYLWHIGMVGLAALLAWRQARNPFLTENFRLRAEAVAGVLYGVTFFIIVIEAATVPLGLPFAAVISAWGLVQRRQLRQEPVTAFLLIAHGIALILFVLWFLRWGAFPEFSDLGLI